MMEMCTFNWFDLIECVLCFPRSTALKFELTLGLQDDMVQFKPLPARSVGSVPTAKQHDLPDFLRRTIFLPRNEIPILLSKLIIRLNSNKSHM
jgi:hypothetical protein